MTGSRATMNPTIAPRSPFLLTICLTAAAATAQATPLPPATPATPVPLPRLTINVAPANQSAMSIDSIADLTGDGIRDVLVGLPGLDVVLVLNGRNGNVLATISGAQFTEFGAEVASVGDMNGDGFEEIAIGAPGTAPDGAAFVYSYNTGAVFPLRAWGPSLASQVSFPGRYGTSITRLGDLNGDGIEEIAASAPFYSTAVVQGYYGLVDVVDAAPLAPIYLSTLVGTFVYEEIGDSLTSLSDLNGDGRRELVVGATRQAWGGTLPGQAPGILRVYSGQSLALGAPVQMMQANGQFAFDAFGASVANLGDVNADGLDELIAGAPDVANTQGSFVRLYNGAATAAGNPTPGYTLTGPAPTTRHFGWALSGIGDVTSDGKPDYLVGAPEIFGASGPGAVYVVNGRTSAVVWTLTAPGQSNLFGYDVSEHGTFGGGRHWLVADPGAGTLYMY